VHEPRRSPRRGKREGGEGERAVVFCSVLYFKGLILHEKRGGRRRAQKREKKGKEGTAALASNHDPDSLSSGLTEGKG